MKHWGIQYLSSSLCVCCFAHLCLSWWKMTHAAHRVLCCMTTSFINMQPLSALRLIRLFHWFLSVLSGKYQKSFLECEDCPAGTYTLEPNREDRCHRCYGDCRPGKGTMSHLYQLNSFTHHWRRWYHCDLWVSIINWEDFNLFFCDSNP